MLTSPVGGVGEVLAALQSLHGLRQSCADLGPVKQGGVEGVCEEFGGSYGYRPQRDADTLDACGQEGSGQTHHAVRGYPAAGLRVQPEAPEETYISGMKPNTV